MLHDQFYHIQVFLLVIEMLQFLDSTPDLVVRHLCPWENNACFFPSCNQSVYLPCG